MMTIIEGGTIVNEGRSFGGCVIVEDDHIKEVVGGKAPRGSYDKRVDATGCFVLPGIIDEHVHFREPGMTAKADIESESRAAAFGGVTTFFDMPNTKPQTTTPEALADKFGRAARESHVNYSFFYGATSDNACTFRSLDPTRIPGVKLFMGASTGDMLVDSQPSLERIFQACAALRLPLMTHCEDTALICANMEEAKRRFGDDPDVRLHPAIRSEEACYRSTALAVRLARQYCTRLHVAHVSTARELRLFFGQGSSAASRLPLITAEAVLAHLLFTDADYASLGARIKCNPAVKTQADREALRSALADGRVATVATDHAPHLPAEKQGGCARAASGMPMVQYALVSMLGLVDEGVLTLGRLVELMCHNPARLFRVSARGFLRPCYKADIVVVKPVAPWTLTAADVQSKCGWSPLEGRSFRWRVQQTFCNGHLVYDRGCLAAACRGEAVRFRPRLDGSGQGDNTLGGA